MAMAAQNSTDETLDHRFDHLLASAKAIGELRNLDELLDFMAKQAASAIKCDRCSIFLLDAEKGEIWSKVALGEKMIRFPKDQGVAGRTIATGEAIILTDAYNDKRFNQEVDRKTGYVTRSLLSVPMRNSEMAVIGCFQLVNKLNGDFNQNDCDYLQAFASQAAVAIESALLYRRQQSMIKDLELAQSNLENKMKELEFVYQLEHALAQSAQINDFVESAIKVIFTFLDVNAAILYFSDQQSFDLFASSKKDAPIKHFNLHSINKLEALQKNSVTVSSESVLEGLSPAVWEALVGQKLDRNYQVPFTFQSVNQNQICVGRLDLAHSQENFAVIHESLLKILSKQLASAVYRFKLLEERDRAHRFTTIGQFSSTIVHDFRNPMMGIRGYAELIQMTAENIDKEQLNQLCEQIIKQVDRCSGMIEELLLFSSGKKNYQFAMCSLPELMQEIEETIKGNAERQQISLQVSCDYGGSLCFDRQKIMRAILNLTNNALEMLQAGDKLLLTAGLNSQGQVEIRVTDSGPGVPPELYSSLFDMFVTKGKNNGTGLGLHITRDIVETHGGRIYLDEKVTQGASFVLCFDPNWRAEYIKGLPQTGDRASG